MITASSTRRQTLSAAAAAAVLQSLMAHSLYAQPVFTDVTASLGITHTHSAVSGFEPLTSGVAAADFDGDGLVDLFFTKADGPDLLYRNTGSGFEDVTAEAGLTNLGLTAGAAAADIDNDGDKDLAVMGIHTDRHFLYINDGAGRFTEEAIARGADITRDPGSPTRKGQGVAFGDYDGDGYLDMLTSDHSRPQGENGSRLLRNLGAANPGHFEDVTEAAGLNVYRTPLATTNPPNTYRFVPQFTDLDRDGHVDIVFASDSRTSQIFWNNGDGTFYDGTEAAGVGTDKSGMGSTLGDYDGDGDLDWFITAIFDTPVLAADPGNRLYQNNGDRTFTDVTTASGVRNSGLGSERSWGWGTSFFDYDNDADLDLMMTNGWVALGYGTDATTLKSNNGDGTFTDVTTPTGIADTGQGRGLLHFDYDLDGDLDVVISNYADTPIVYRNDGGNNNNWLRVEAEGTVSNRDGIGAFVTIVPDKDNPDELQVREIHSGESYLAQSESVAHFGLGDLSGTVDIVEVFWPASGIVQRFTDVPVNSILNAQEQLVGDIDGDGDVDLNDALMYQRAGSPLGSQSDWYHNFSSSTDPAAPSPISDSADLDSDGDVDVSDALLGQRLGIDLNAWGAWEAGFGASLAGQPGFYAVPEPSTLAGTTLLLWSLMATRTGARTRARS